MQLTTMEIAARCNKSERTIQRWLKEGTLKAQHIERNVFEISEDDLQEHLPHEIVDSLAARISELERQVSELQAIIREMANHPPMRRVTPPRPVYEAGEATGKGLSRSTLWRHRKKQREATQE
jgi:excisionase family DNA binding protein